MKHNRKTYALEFKKYIEDQLNIEVMADGDIYLSGNIFDKLIKIIFSDESSVSFRYASIVDIGAGDKLILTEHCGYHVFHITEDDSLIITKNK